MKRFSSCVCSYICLQRKSPVSNHALAKSDNILGSVKYRKFRFWCQSRWGYCDIIFQRPNNYLKIIESDEQWTLNIFTCLSCIFPQETICFPSGCQARFTIWNLCDFSFAVHCFVSLSQILTQGSFPDSPVATRLPSGDIARQHILRWIKFLYFTFF